MRVPVGVSDFGTIVTGYDIFVDKSLFAQEIADLPTGSAILITRPRRHGKTFAMSMLHHFFAAHVYGKPTKGLFDGLLIHQIEGNYVKNHQGQYPVIFTTFKGLKYRNFADTGTHLKFLMSRLFAQHAYLLKSPKLTTPQKDQILSFIKQEIPVEALRLAFLVLSEDLAIHHQKKVILLIDEYDTPILEAYSEGFADEILSFMRGLLGEGLKDNPFLEKAVVTGIMRVAKESLFSDLNNLLVFSPFDKQFQNYFGFTREETETLLEKVALRDTLPQVTSWYNGYTIGELQMYNPWSIMSFIYYKGELRTFWVNTSENKLIYDLLKKASEDTRRSFNVLLRGEAIEKRVYENISLREMGEDGGLWTLLFYTGYLRATDIERQGNVLKCKLAIPNKEIMLFYQNAVERMLALDHSLEWYQSFIDYLLRGDVPAFAERLQGILMTRFTLRELRHDYHEAHYQGFMSGLLASISQDLYDIRNQGEGRDGYYDIAIIPRTDKTKPLILFEFKAVKESDAPEEKCQRSARAALLQIETRGYALPFEKQGYRNIIKVGVAFSTKYAAVVAPSNPT